MSSLFDLAARLTLDSSDYESGLKKAEGSAGKFKQSIGTAMKVGGAGIAAGTAAVVAFGATSVKTGMGFDKSMSQVAATMGKTMEQLQTEVGSTETSFGHFEGNLEQFAQFMGKNTAFSASQAADALNYMALAGYDAQQSMSMLPNVLNLAAAGNMDLAMASDMVTDAQTALGLNAGQTEKLVDQMAKTASKSNTSVSQLGEAILTIGATARNVKGGTVELNTVLGVLADNGIKGAEGGTHLRNMILSLQTPTKDGAKALKKLGMSYKDMYDESGNLRSLPEIFQQMSEKMEGMTQQSKDAIISGIFNKTDLAAVNALLGTTGERWDELALDILASKDAASEMAKTQLDNLAGDVTLFKSALEGAQLIVSKKLTPSLRKFVQFGTNGIGRLTDAFEKGGLNGMMKELGTLLSEAINMIIAMLPQVINAAVELIGAFVKGLIDNAPKIIEAAGQIVGTLGMAIIENLPYLVQSALDILLFIGNYLADHADEVIPMVVDLMIQLANIVIDNADKFVDAAIKLLIALKEGLFKALPEIAEKLPELIIKMAEVLLENANKILEVGVQLVTELANGLIQNWPAIKEAIGELWKKLQQVWEEKGGTIREYGAAVINYLKEGWDLAVAGVKFWINEFIIWLSNGWDSVISTIKTWGSNLVTSIQEGFTEKSGEFIEFVTGKFTELRDGIQQIFANIKVWAGQIITNIKTGITDKFGGLFETAQEKFQSVKDKMNEIWGDAKTWGEDMITNIRAGIQEKYGPFLSNVGLKFEAIRDKMTGTIEEAKKTISGIIEKIKGLFDFEWHLPDIKTPHFHVNSHSKKVLGVWLPSIEVEWYKKAYDNPLLFTKPTIVGNRGFGDGGGSGEIVYGRDQLMRDIAAASQGEITINVYASDGMDINALADKIEERLTQVQKQRSSVYA